MSLKVDDRDGQANHLEVIGKDLVQLTKIHQLRQLDPLIFRTFLQTV